MPSIKSRSNRDASARQIIPWRSAADKAIRLNGAPLGSSKSISFPSGRARASFDVVFRPRLFERNHRQLGKIRGFLYYATRFFILFLSLFLLSIRENERSKVFFGRAISARRLKSTSEIFPARPNIHSAKMRVIYFSKTRSERLTGNY